MGVTVWRPCFFSTELAICLWSGYVLLWSWNHFFTGFWWLLMVNVTRNMTLLILFCRPNGDVIAKPLSSTLIIYSKLFFFFFLPFQSHFPTLLKIKERDTHLWGKKKKEIKHALEVFFFSGEVYVIITIWACLGGGHIL